ncbi:3346_t:CDS:2 [Diversispora eburnea]|uniref:3346_t:CDS:1 n=1 Tax=Diversispora eburnea TaxID=1213867 RepID=A0A9N8ZQ41_9GLOM|nr:3346_t:CDS:2 [Diversispora eburnea]
MPKFDKGRNRISPYQGTPTSSHRFAMKNPFAEFIKPEQINKQEYQKGSLSMSGVVKDIKQKKQEEQKHIELPFFSKIETPDLKFSSHVSEKVTNLNPSPDYIPFMWQIEYYLELSKSINQSSFKMEKFPSGNISSHRNGMTNHSSPRVQRSHNFRGGNNGVRNRANYGNGHNLRGMYKRSNLRPPGGMPTG